MNEIKVSINLNGLLSKKITFKILNNDTIDFNKHVHDIDIFINDKVAFDQQESEVNLHSFVKATSSPSNVSPGNVCMITSESMIVYLFFTRS
jgi:hypothetical protein